MNQSIRNVRPNVAEVALGNVLEWGIQRWVAWSGREARISDAPWLEGPIGESRIGPDFYAAYAREEGLELVEDDPETGLLTDFSVLSGGGFDAAMVRPEIRDFYERTALYGLDVRPEWSGPLRYSARTLIYLVSRNIQQLNLPVSPVAADGGMSSELIGLRDPLANEAPYCGWLRRSLATGAVIYAGLYTTCRLPGREGRFVRVVFPLPGGSATVVLRPENRPDGSLALVSAGEGFGDAGYYRVHRGSDARLRAKYVPLKEEIHVFVDRAGTLRTNHTLSFWRARFLTLHYEISQRAISTPPPSGRPLVS
jgi:hypothetical protein